jgi:hypothetical protein
LLNFQDCWVLNNISCDVLAKRKNYEFLFWLTERMIRGQTSKHSLMIWLINNSLLLPCVYVNRERCKGTPKVGHHMSVSIWYIRDQLNVHIEASRIRIIASSLVIWLFSKCNDATPLVLFFSFFFFCFLVIPASCCQSDDMICNVVLVIFLPAFGVSISP